MNDIKNINYKEFGDYKVIAKCFTYNQSKYIADTLNGFVKQKTNFPYICLVLDDCSKDGEQQVIENWLDKECDMSRAKYYENELSRVICAPHSQNHNCSFAVYLLKGNLYKQQEKKDSLVIPWRQFCSYEATCEGDDYWIDENKLQVQYDFMESHPDVTLSCTRLYDYTEGTSDMYVNYNYYFDDNKSSEEYFLFDRDDAYSHRWFTHYLTYFYRFSALDTNFLYQFQYSRDVHIVYSLLSKGKGVCHNIIGAVYRRNSGGIYSSNDYLNRYLIDFGVFQEFYNKTKDKVIGKILRDKYEYLLKMHCLILPKSFFEYKTFMTYCLNNKKEVIKWFVGILRVNMALRKRLSSQTNIIQG